MRKLTEIWITFEIGRKVRGLKPSSTTCSNTEYLGSRAQCFLLRRTRAACDLLQSIRTLQSHQRKVTGNEVHGRESHRGGLPGGQQQLWLGPPSHCYLECGKARLENIMNPFFVAVVCFGFLEELISRGWLQLIAGIPVRAVWPAQT